MSRWLVWGLLACAVAGIALAVGAFGPVVPAIVPRPRERPIRRASTNSRLLRTPIASRGKTPAPADVRWIAAGGGPVPELNQVSLAQDLALAADVLGDGGLVLFASGQEGRVQVLDDRPRGDPLLARLADLFAPRQGRDARYEPAPLAADGEATADHVLGVLRETLAAGDAPLLVYLATHGDMGDTARDNRLLLWGDSEIAPGDLARGHDESPGRRPVRFVVTACHSGGFAEILYRDAREENGPAAGTRCGLFAATWDLKATGCDPDPDRRVQEGYGLHFLHALRGRDRDGAPLDPSLVDFDHDGHVTLLEAHTRARIASASIDVPTTTSERWLRSAAPTSGRGVPVPLPEDDAVIAALAPRLGLSGHPDDARDRLADDEEALQQLEGRAEDVDRRAGEATRVLTAALLARWPVLDDPWHPDWTETVSANREAIAELLEQHPAAAEIRAAAAEQDHVADQTEALELEVALLERLVRALDDEVLAARLHARGGRPWQVYERLLTCERTEP